MAAAKPTNDEARRAYLPRRERAALTRQWWKHQWRRGRVAIIATPWHPATILRVDVIRLSWLMVVLALVRGLDYATGRDSVIAAAPLPGQSEPRSPLVGIEAAFPLWLWAAGLLLWCVGLTVGMRFGRHALVWLSHVMLSALYAGLTVGLFLGYLERPFFDGIRNASVLLLPTSIHALLWWRMGPTPVEPETHDG